MTFIRTATGIEELRVPLWLYKLLAVTPLSNRLKIGPEDRLAIDFATMLRQEAMNGRLSGVFTHIPHEVGGGGGRASEARYAVANAMGLVAGSGDYVFTRKGHGLWLEAKRPKLTKAKDGRSDSGGKLNEKQEMFAQWCLAQGVDYAVFTTLDQGRNLLVQHGFLV